MRTVSSKRQQGTTLIETMIATAICLVAVFGLAGLVSMSTRQSKEMGSTVAQAAQLAAQKMDLLMALAMSDTRLNAGGSLTCSPLSTCTDTYIDFLDPTGQCLGPVGLGCQPVGTPVTLSTAASNAGVFFIRRWEVINGGTGNVPTGMKQIGVRVEGNAIGTGIKPSATVVCYKAQ